MTSSKSWTAAALAVLAAFVTGCGGTTAAPTPTQPPASIDVSSTASSQASSTPRGGVSSTTSGPAASSSSAVPHATATESNPPGDIPDNQAFVAFTPPGAAVAVKVPEGWARSTAGSATVFSDKLNRIEITPSRAASAPTVSSVTDTDVAKLRATVPKFAAGKVGAERRTAGSVILVTYQGDSPQDPVTGKVVRDAFERHIYFNHGKRLDLTLSGPTNADNVDPWRTVSDSVRWR